MSLGPIGGEGGPRGTLYLAQVVARVLGSLTISTRYELLRDGSWVPTFYEPWLPLLFHEQDKSIEIPMPTLEFSDCCFALFLIPLSLSILCPNSLPVSPREQ